MFFSGSNSKIKKLNRKIEALEQDLDDLKSKLDLTPDLADQFFRDRSSAPYIEAFTKEEPLISVCVATYNRGRLLAERSVRSILNQTYKNLELIVVGDGCTDDTPDLMAEIKDNRVRFINLEQRGSYPENPFFRWMVAGTTPVAHALGMARGDFVTHLDDDDEFMPDRLEKLLRFIREARADILWHPFWGEGADGKWRLKECLEFKKGQVTTSSVFYHHWFRKIPWEIDAYRYREPGDWNRFRKFKYIGANAVRFPEPLLRHYQEKKQVTGQP
ncbi:MAG: glycosyltransferase family 2 protein [Desulfuromonadales bacterium]